MPFIILGVAMLAGIGVWAIVKDVKAPKVDLGGGEKDSPGVEGVAADAISKIESGPPTTASAAQGESVSTTGTVAIKADGDETGDRTFDSGAASAYPDMDRWTADVFTDDDPYVPGVELSTRLGDEHEPDEYISWVFDDVVSPRDIASTVTNPDDGNMPAQMAK